MTAVFTELERVESRIVGAIRFVDTVTRTPIPNDGFQVTAQGVRFLRNRSGLRVIYQAPGFDAYAASFESPPLAPAVGSVNLVIAISDPAQFYLPRSMRITLPRDSDSAAFAAATSLFQPIDVLMFPAPAAAVAVNWAVLRVGVLGGNGDHLGGALLRVLRNGSELGSGLTDWRGEALVPVAGVPVTTFGENAGAVVTSEIDVTLQVVFDPTAGSRVSDADVRIGRPPSPLPVVDPSALEAGIGTLPGNQLSLSIAARRSQSVTLVVG
jgi:hypothetical protein